MIGSFSYNIRDMETVETATKEAERLGISFSDFVVRSLKAAVASGDEGKKVNGPTSIGVEFRSSTIDEFNNNIVLRLKNLSPMEQTDLINGLDNDDLERLRESCVGLSVKCAQTKKQRRFR